LHAWHLHARHLLRCLLHLQLLLLLLLARLHLYLHALQALH
jgi:hypothetical protein